MVGIVRRAGKLFAAAYMFGMCFTCILAVVRYRHASAMTLMNNENNNIVVTSQQQTHQNADTHTRVDGGTLAEGDSVQRKLLWNTIYVP